MDILKKTKPISRKEHRCEFCGGIIKVGEGYERTTIADECVYDFVCHCHCAAIANMLDMYYDCYDEGLSSDAFQENIIEYIRVNHDKETVQIELKLPFPELVEKVYQELKEKEDRK